MRKQLDYTNLMYSNKGFGVTLLSNAISLFFIITSLFFIGFSLIYVSVPVDGNSMQPTLNAPNQPNSDIVYINRISSYTRNDLIVIKKENEYGKYIIKRLVAIGGDTIKVIQGLSPSGYVIILNGEIIDESGYLYEYLVGTDNDGTLNTYRNMLQLQSTHGYLFNEHNELVVPDGYVFALGDNRGISRDSSELGPFKESDVLGKVDHIIYNSQNEIKYFLNKYTPFSFK